MTRLALDDIKSQRLLLSKISLTLGINKNEDWYRVKRSQFEGSGGTPLLKIYSNSHTNAIVSILSEIDWHIWKFDTVPKDHWKSLLNQRNHLDCIAKDLGVCKLEDWYSISTATYLDQGGSRTLLDQYGKSLSKALMSVYQDHGWREYQFQRVGSKYWENPARIHSLMDDIASFLNIRTNTDWYKISSEEFESHPFAKKALSRFGHPIKAIVTTYPEYPWNVYKFTKMSIPEAYWSDTSFHKNYLDDLCKKLNHESKDDLYQLSRELILENGGARILAFYSNSIRDMITSIYPDYPWDDFLFDSTKCMWTSQRTRQYLLGAISKNEARLNEENLREKLANLSRFDIERCKDSSAFFREHRSIDNSIRMAFPELMWERKDAKIISYPQKLIAEMMSQTLQSGTTIHINFLHPNLIHSKSQHPMELDIWIPSLNLAIEYQGEQHYVPYSSSSTQSKELNQIERDKEKQKRCEEIGITLVQIPYWWNREKDQLLSTLRKYTSVP